MSRVTKVGLVQIGDSFGNQHYLPYSIGVLQSYAQKKMQDSHRFHFLIPIYKRIKIKQAVSFLIDADIVFFSTYLWNFRISLEIANQLKRAKPECVIAFGGPQIPENSGRLESLLRNHSQIDIGCFGEGEKTFLSILNLFDEANKWNNIPSIGFISEDDFFLKTPHAERIQDLDEILSPYLNGTFEPLIRANPQENWSAMLETNRGCPFTCAFCAWGAGNKRKLIKYSKEKIFAEIDWFSKQKIEFVFCCDANFGILPRDIEIARKTARNKLKFNFPKSFSVQNTKNSSEKIFELQKILNDAGLQKGVNLALQSTNPKTLRSINRENINIGVYHRLQEDFTREGIPTFSDIILGLPDETYNSFTNGISSIIEAGQHNRIQFINLTVLENTEMAEPYFIKKHGLRLQESKIISHHTNMNNEEEVFERQFLVVATKTMPRNDWLKARTFCWLTALLHFNKTLQIPLILLNNECRISYKDLIEAFLFCEKEKFPVISHIKDIMVNKAIGIQNGESEYIPSEQWLNIWWPVDEYLFIKLVRDDSLNAFYNEALQLLTHFLTQKSIDFPIQLLKESISLNQDLIKKPLIQKNKDLTLNYNIPEYYEKVINGVSFQIKEQKCDYTIDRVTQKWDSMDKWCRNVVWYGSKKGDFLYSVS
jgi:radical SAM superfamily enzyme YgiQ (UPF0313 family)